MLQSVSSAVALGWWLEGEDEGVRSESEGDHHFATEVITGIAVRDGGWERRVAFGTPLPL